MPLASWLFVKDGQTIWIERPHGCVLIVAGPGSAREEQDFPDEQALDAFQIALGERLTAGGWFLWAFDRERRTARERRTVARETPQRRRSSPGAQR
jgi:hypothetical protein